MESALYTAHLNNVLSPSFVDHWSRISFYLQKMSSTHGALVVFGSGPGVGRTVAALFAERGFEKVILMSRDATRLAQDADFVRSARADTSVHEIPVDLGNMEHVQESLKRVDNILKDTSLECVLFNAARTGKSEFFDFSPATFENDLKVR
jgi:short-subunit dehydrogenase